MNPRLPFLARALPTALALATLACGGEPEAPAVKTGELVSGSLKVTSFGSPNAAETASVITPFNGTYNKVVAFNYDDPAHISYTATTRTTTTGASGIGWNFAIGGGTTDQFQALNRRLTPPPGWPILWGDPGLGTNGAGKVFMTSLAVPQQKMPAGPISGDMGPFLGGACIARSDDGGQNFALVPQDCVHDAAFNFYDGSDITGTTANGPVVAAFYNTVTNRIDVWVAPTPANSFSMIADPFPGKIIVDHPRLRSFGSTVWLIAADQNKNIWLRSYANGAWGNVILGGTLYDKRNITVGTQLVRRGASYDLAFAPSTVGPGTLYIAYTKFGNNHSYISGAACQASCTQNFFTIDPGTNTFHPAMATFQQGNPGGAGTFGVITWMTSTGGDMVRVFANRTFQSGGALSGTIETSPTPVCSDLRGYWGDYDAHMAVLPASWPNKPLFWRSFADSTDTAGNASCTRRWQFNSLNVNVSMTWISL